jgi:hypothetical protein
MGATNKDSILRSLDLNAALIESLPEPVLSELIGFIEYDDKLAVQDSDDGGSQPLATCCAVALSDV